MPLACQRGKCKKRSIEFKTDLAPLLIAEMSFYISLHPVVYMSRGEIYIVKGFHKKPESLFLIKLRKQLIIVTFLFSLRL